MIICFSATYPCTYEHRKSSYVFRNQETLSIFYVGRGFPQCMQLMDDPKNWEYTMKDHIKKLAHPFQQLILIA